MSNGRDHFGGDRDHHRGLLAMGVGAAGSRSPVPGARAGEAGYAMAALLVGLAVMAVVMTMAMPVWSTAGQARARGRAGLSRRAVRSRHRALSAQVRQRAAAQHRRPGERAVPPPEVSRPHDRRRISSAHRRCWSGRARRWRGRGEGRGRRWRRADAALAAGGAGGRHRCRAQTANRERWRGSRAGGDWQDAARRRSAFGAAGGIVGVASKSTEKSLRLYNGRGAYNEWTFVAVQRQQQAGAGAGRRAGARPGRGGRGETGRDAAAAAAAPGPESAGRGPASFRPPAGDGGRGLQATTPGR